MTAELEDLLEVVDALADGGDLRPDQGEDPTGRALTNVLSWDAATWRSVLCDLPLDSSTFLAQFEVSWDEVIETLAPWCRRASARRDDRTEAESRFLGHAGLLLTLIALRYSEQRRAPVPDRAHGTGDPAEPGTGRTVHDSTEACRFVVALPEVQRALHEVYAPGPDDDERTHRVWRSLDFSGLSFHRHGTTSFILRGRSAYEEQAEDLAIKCLLLPFLRIPAISNAAKNYERDYRVTPREKHLVRVRASTGAWIVMDFVEGRTLAETLATERFTGQLRLDLVEKFGRQLFLALAELEARGFEHRDLSPSNIIVVERDDHEEVHLIDLGVNSLYLHQMPGQEAPDARYVAPEIRAPVERRRHRPAPPVGPDHTGRSDLYSLGQLLIGLGCGRHEPDGTVPDVLYAEAPLLARFVEDLIDHRPERRLLVFRPAGPVYRTLLTYFEEEISAVRAARDAGLPTGRREVWKGGREAFLPVSGAVSRQLRLWQARRKQSLYRDHGGALGVRWLLACSVVAAGVWAGTSLLVLTWAGRELGVDLPGAALSHVPLPLAWRADDYGFAPGAGPLALGILTLTYLAIMAKYYLSVFAGATPLVSGRRQGRLSLHAVGTEVAVRLWTFLPLPLTGPIFLVQPRWWPILPPIGMSLVLLSNGLSYTFVGHALRAARSAGLSVASPDRLGGRRYHWSWLTGNIFHSLGLWIVGVLLISGVAADARAYIILLVAWNIQLYFTRTVAQGSDVRATFARGCAAAERLSRLRRGRSTVPVPMPAEPAGLPARA